MHSLGTCDYMSDECVIQLLVPQVRSLLGVGFQPRSRINNHFDTSAFFYVARTSYVGIVLLESLQQSKWRCDVRELW